MRLLGYTRSSTGTSAPVSLLNLRTTTHAKPQPQLGGGVGHPRKNNRAERLAVCSNNRTDFKKRAIDQVSARLTIAPADDEHSPTGVDTGGVRSRHRAGEKGGTAECHRGSYLPKSRSGPRQMCFFFSHIFLLPAAPMGRSALLFALSAAAWGGCAVKSFSFRPGSPHQASSCKPAAPMGRTTLARSKDVDLLRATRSLAVAESAEYLENKEALKQVRRSLCNPACAWLNCFPWDVLTANTIFPTHDERVRSKQQTAHSSDDFLRSRLFCVLVHYEQWPLCWQRVSGCCTRVKHPALTTLLLL